MICDVFHISLGLESGLEWESSRALTAETLSWPGASAYAVVMAEPAQSTPPRVTENFASVLASLTTTDKMPNVEWDLSELADDVATISYEEKLRVHRPGRAFESATEELPKNPPNSAVPPASNCALPSENKRKTASITLRLTQSEQNQLHERAAAAKLSVSAYIRSCVFEAELLRTQVKEALSQIRAAADKPQTPCEGQPAAAPHRRFHLFPRWSGHKKAEA